MEDNVTHYHNKCGGLMIEMFACILKVKGSNPTNGVFMVNNGKFTEYSLILFPNVCAHLS